MLEIITVLGICYLLSISFEGCATLITVALVIGLCAFVISNWEVVVLGLAGLFLIAFIIAVIVDGIKGGK